MAPEVSDFSAERRLVQIFAFEVLKETSASCWGWCVFFVVANHKNRSPDVQGIHWVSRYLIYETASLTTPLYQVLLAKLYKAFMIIMKPS